MNDGAIGASIGEHWQVRFDGSQNYAAWWWSWLFVVGFLLYICVCVADINEIHTEFWTLWVLCFYIYMFAIDHGGDWSMAIEYFAEFCGMWGSPLQQSQLRLQERVLGLAMQTTHYKYWPISTWEFVWESVLNGERKDEVDIYIYIYIGRFWGLIFSKHAIILHVLLSVSFLICEEGRGDWGLETAAC